MTAQLYLQKAEMQFARGLEEKALESWGAAGAHTEIPELRKEPPL